MTTVHPDLDGCDDCLAVVFSHPGTSPVTGGNVLVVTVEHELSCPTWRLKLSPHPELQVSAPTPDRLLIHTTRDAA